MKKIIFVVIVFVLGMFGLGGVNAVFHFTNEMEFCTSCHSMKINLEEYKETIHYKNGSGVRATCADCHVPKSFFPKLQAKIFAAKDVYHEIIGTVDTKEKFDAHRWNMASRVWAKMKATDSRECRSCHDFDAMDLSAQERTARKKHPRAKMQGETCIDCHKGIAHEQPEEPEGTEGQVASKLDDEKDADADKADGSTDKPADEKSGDGDK